MLVICDDLAEIGSRLLHEYLGVLVICDLMEMSCILLYGYLDFVNM